MFLYQCCWHPFGQSMGTRFIHTSWLKLTLMCALVWSTSINWLKADEPNAAAAVPNIVCSNFIQSIPTPRENSKNPKNVVTSTKKFSRTFINTAKSCLNPGGVGLTNFSPAGFSSVTVSSMARAKHGRASEFFQAGTCNKLRFPLQKRFLDSRKFQIMLLAEPH